MKNHYLKIVEWSDEDQCFIGSCPDLFYGGCHGDDEKKVFDELCQLVEENMMQSENQEIESADDDSYCPVSHEEFVEKLLSNPEVRREYEKLQNSNEFKLLDEILAARQSAGLTQEQIAKRMKVRKSAVVRLENALISGKDSLSIGTLKKYANAVGKKVEVHLV